MRKGWVCALTLWHILVPCLLAQHYGFQQFGRDEGLKSLEIQGLFQDNRGFIWVGTRNGLYRYEGQRFAYFHKTNGLPGVSIQSIHQTSDGTLWVAASEGLARFDGLAFRPVKLKTNYKIYGAHTIDSLGDALYFTTDHGLVIGRRTAGDWKFESASSKPASGVYAAQNGRVWFGCAHKLCALEGGNVAEFGSESGVPEEGWGWIGATPQGEMAARSANHLIVFKSSSSGASLEGRPREENVAPASFRAPAPAFDDQGHMLVPTIEGLAIRQNNGTWKYVGSAQGLADDNVSCVLQDREGALWIGAAGFGLVRWPGYGVWETWGREEGLVSTSLWTLQYDSNGTLWAGTNRGLHRLVNGHWERWPKTGIPTSQELTFAFGPDSTIWVGSYPHGLYQVDSRTGVIRAHYGEGELGSPWIFGLVTDTTGRLWVSTFGGLFRSNGSGRNIKFERQSPPGTEAKEVFHRCLVDHRGRVWAPGDRGLAVFDKGKWRRITTKDGLKYLRVITVAEAADGSIWMSYFLRPGLARIEEEGGQFRITHPSLQNGPESNLIYSLTFDRTGNLWAGTDAGVHVLRSGAWNHYDQGNGLAWNDTNENSLLAGPQNDIWVGTVRGLSHFLGHESGREFTPPDVAITAVNFGDKPAVGARSPEIPYRDRSFRIRFAALTFQEEQEVLFRYRFAGLDNKWVTTSSRELQVPQLQAGHYQFVVEARSARGVWSPKPAEFRFRILPPWYLEWWAIAGGLIGAGLFIWAVYRLRVRRFMKRQKRLEAMVLERTRELKEAKEKAEDSSRLKSEFLAMMSHEIRTPMNGVLGMTNAMLLSSTSSEQRENLELVKGAGESLLALLNGLLDLSRIESGKLPLDNAPFSLSECIGFAKRTVAPEAKRKGLDLTCSITEGIPDGFVGDSGRLRQVLINLLGNAVKFTDTGFVRLAVTTAGEDTANHVLLRFAVSDSGIGIEADKQTVIFEPFRQADNSTTRKYGGTGLGLAISQKLVEMMDGFIAVDSEVGKGSTFYFELSLLPAPVESALEREPDRKQGSENRKYSILLADDNRLNCHLTARLLSHRGHAVSVAKNGREAVEQFVSRPFDVVLMDVQMPEMDGLAATAQIRDYEHGRGTHARIVAMTANAMMGDREECLAAGMDDYLSKPFQPEELFAKIEGARVAQPTQAECDTAV